MKNIKLLLLVLLGSIAVSPLHAAGQKRQAPGSDERTAKRLRTEAPEHKVADGWDGFVDADDQVLPDALEDSSFNDADEKRIVANRVAPEQQAGADQAEAGSLNPCTNCQYQNDATTTECGVCAYKPGEVIEQQVVHNHPKDKVVKTRNAKHQKLDEGTQAPTPSHAHTFTFEAFFPNGGGCEDLFWVHGYEFFHIDDVYNLVKTNKTIHSAFFTTVLKNYPQIRQILLNGGNINQRDTDGKQFVDRAICDNNLPLLHLLTITGAELFIFENDETFNQACQKKPLIKKFIQACVDLYSTNFSDFLTIGGREVQLAQEALIQGAYVNCQFKRNTTLSEACRQNKITFVRYLLSIPKIDVNAVDEFGDTALTIASRACDYFPNSDMIIKLLLDNQNINIDIKNNNRKTALALIKISLTRSPSCSKFFTIKQLFEEFQARQTFTALENSASTLPHPLFHIHGIILIVGEFLGAREPKPEVVQDQEDGK